MQKIISLAGLAFAAALLAGCTPGPSVSSEAPVIEVTRNPDDIQRVVNVSVVEYPTPAGPSLMVEVQMDVRMDLAMGDERIPVSPAEFRRAIALSLEQASSSPAEVGLIFLAGDSPVDVQSATTVVPDVVFSSGGVILTGDQARAAVG